MPGESSTPLRVLVSDERGRPISGGGVGGWLARVAPRSARGIVHVAVVSDATVRGLNRRYRRKDRTTDVLSFPSGVRNPDPRPPTRGPRPPAAVLGDIVIARGVTRRQARVAGHSEAIELRVLALHGLLHLLGYDHERDHGRMQRVERQLLRAGGVADGLISRQRRPVLDTRERPGANR